MKIAGIILIVLQIVAIMGGGIPTGGVAVLLGYFLPGILGVFLLVKSSNKKAKKDAEGQ